MILGIDVGVSTGLALYDPDTDSIIMTSVSDLRHLEWTLSYYVQYLGDGPIVVEFPTNIGIAAAYIRYISDSVRRKLLDYEDTHTIYNIRPAEWKTSVLARWYQENNEVPTGTTQHEKDAANIARYWFEKEKH